MIGVFAKAKGGFFGQNGMDNAVTMPLQTARERYPQLTGYQITAKARPGHRDEAVEEIRAAMRRIRHVPDGKEDDFNLTTPDQIIKQFNQITGMIGLVAIAISSLGLLVGGVGVMNIMLMSVTERTREIGTRIAIGARADGHRRPVPDGSRLADGPGRHRGPAMRRRDHAILGRLCAVDSVERAAVGGARRSRHLRSGRRVLRRLARCEGVAARPGGGAALRVAPGSSTGDKWRIADRRQVGK